MKWKLWLNLFTFAALGLVIYLAWPDIIEAVEKARKLNFWILLSLIPAQLAVYWAMAKMFEAFFRSAGIKKLKLKQLFAPMLELNFVNHVFPSGGVSGFSYLTLRLKSYDVSTAKSTLAQLARFICTFIVYIGLMLFALLLLAASGKTNSFVVYVVTSLTFLILFAVAILIFVIEKEHRIVGFVKFVTRWLNKVIHLVKRDTPEKISLENMQTTFMELHQDYIFLRRDKRQLKSIFTWATLMSLFELLLPYLVFVAHGEWVNPGAVIVAFVIAGIVGYVAVLPGGVGVYEPMMAGIFVACGIPAPLALSVTLIYRVAAQVISLVSGYALYQRAVHRYGKAEFSRK